MIIAVVAVFGLLLGSFVNAFVWRLHEQQELFEKKKKPSKQQLAKLSILHGRSMCPDCKHELAAKDLVPVFSWLWLRGKCRYCRKPIAWQYPAVELVTASLFALSYGFWPTTLSSVTTIVPFGFWLFFVVMFMALAVYDLKWFLLPDKVVLPLIAVAGVDVLFMASAAHSPRLLLDAALGGLILSGLFYILFQVSDGTWIGGGDVKLAVILGLLAGTPLKALLVLFLASVLGILASLPLLVRKKQTAHEKLTMRIPFGPFLLAATCIVVLFGSRVIDWYTSLFLGV